MYNIHEERAIEKRKMENLNKEAYIEFLRLEKECNSHNVAETMKIMQEEFDGIKPKEFNKYKKFIKESTHFENIWVRRIQWNKSWDYVKTKEK